MKIRLCLLLGTLILTVCAFDCGHTTSDNPYDAQAPKTTKESSYFEPAINHGVGKATSQPIYLYGYYKPSNDAVEAAIRGIERTRTVLAREYGLNAPGYSGPQLLDWKYYALVFWKASPLCTSAPAFTVSYVVMDPNDPYDNDGYYDKDPRKARVTICASGKSNDHQWNQGKEYDDSPDRVHRMDLVEDPAMAEATARHEALHLGLQDVDIPRYNATIYHGGDWEQILAKTDPNAVEFAGRPKPVYARIHGTIDGQRQDFSVILVK